MIVIFLPEFFLYIYRLVFLSSRLLVFIRIPTYFFTITYYMNIRVVFHTIFHSSTLRVCEEKLTPTLNSRRLSNSNCRA